MSNYHMTNDQMKNKYLHKRNPLLSFRAAKLARNRHTTPESHDLKISHRFFSLVRTIRNDKVFFQYTVSLALITLLAASCAEEVPLPELIPVVRVEAVTPDNVIEFDNEVTLTIFYEDGNGDLGSEDPDKEVLFVQDSRLENPDGYHVQPLAPLESNIPIQGTLEIKLNPLFLLGNGSEETVNLSISIVDRAGNVSAIADAPPITVRR